MLESRTHEETRPGSNAAATTRRRGGSRAVMSYIPVVSAALGITIVITSVVFFYVEDDLRRLVSVTLGLGILIGSVWFAANPFLRNTRRFVPLRKEVESFVDLVRQVNDQAVEAKGPEVIESTKARMHEAVENIVAKAGERS